MNDFKEIDNSIGCIWITIVGFGMIVLYYLNAILNHLK